MSGYKIIVKDFGEISSFGEYGCIYQSLNILLKGRPVRGCLSGGCGICKMRIIEGQFVLKGKMSRAHISESEESSGVVLGCQVVPCSTVAIELLSVNLRKRFVR